MKRLEHGENMSCEDYWIDKYAKRKLKIIQLLEKYVRVRNKCKIEIVNERFEFEINKLREELININKLLDLI